MQVRSIVIYNIMGCTSSDSLLQNSIIIRNVTNENKEKLGDAIEDNDLIYLAITMQEIQAYPNSEISQSKMGWMLTHLCCRWDSDLCLEYLLRLYFVENPRGYINFVNSQTAEGYTCLHLCCIWNSVKCFKILHSFGGLELNLRDNKLKTAYEDSIQYKSTQISQVLFEYTKLKIEFTFIKVENLLEGPLIAPKQSERKKSLNQFAFDFKSYERMTDCQMMTQAENDLLVKKAEIEKELGNLLMKKLEKQLDYDIKRALVCIYAEIQELQKDEYEKLQKQKLYNQMRKQQKETEKQVQSKQHSLRVLNRQIQKKERERMEKLKKQYEVKAQQSFMKLNLELSRKIKEKSENLQSYKIQATCSKLRQTKNFKKIQDCDSTNIKQLPQNIVKQYEEAKVLGLFTDSQFPADNSSIGDSSKSKYYLFTSDIIWLRPREIFKEQFKLFDGIDPFDIKQGSLGVCYMLATVSALAANPKNIEKIFVFHDVNIGFYVLKLFVNGIPTFFVVDDLIPCCKTTKSPLFTQPIGKEIWVLLLEKAWAKLIGSYLSAQSMTPDHMMQDLSGAPAYGWWLTKQNLKTPTEKIKEIVKHSALGHIVVVTSISDRKIEGIVNNHAYSLLEVIEFNNRYVFKIRNPWGRFEWNGEYGEKSSLNTEEFKKKVSYDSKDDGIFFISENQLIKAFCFYSISHVKSDYCYTYEKFSSQKWQNLYFRLTLPKPGEVNIRVTQPFDRMVNDTDYKYSPMIFEIGKIISKNQILFISEGHQRTYFGAKSVHAFQDIFQYLEEGDYFIRVQMLWHNDQKYNKGVLGCYSGVPVKINRIQDTQGQQMLKNLFFSFAKNSPQSRANHGLFRISTMKGQFLFIAQSEEEGEFRVNFKFNKQKMNKTETDIGKTGSVELEAVVSKTKYGVCTAKRVQPSQGGTTGPVCITFTKL